MAKAAKLKTNGTRKTKSLELVSIDPEASSTNGSRINVLKTYKMYIEGKFPRSESERYYLLKSENGEPLANVCRGSRKDFRNAVVAARNAFTSWAERTAYNRGQILYRIAEMLESRKSAFIAELMEEGSSQKEAEREVLLSIDRLVYYAGWSDKYQQVFSSVNPVSSSHFNFSLQEPMGVISIIAPEEPSLLGLVSVMAPAIVGGNTVIILASHSKPLTAVSFAEVLNSSDVPSSVVNILTGMSSELISHMSSHMDVNAIFYTRSDSEEIKTLQQNAALNIKRVTVRSDVNWGTSEGQSPYYIMDFQETKTTWHPIGI